MRQQSYQKLSGLQVLQNSLTVKEGFFERADNVRIVQDYIVTKRRGLRNFIRYQAGQVVNLLFNYQTSVFTITQNTLYRNPEIDATAQVKSFVGSANIIVRKTAHGIRNSDYISEFSLINSDPFVAAFPKRQANFYGINQVTTQFTQNAARNANVVTVTQTSHGLNTGDTINVTASTLGTPIVPGVKTITVTGANTFTFADTAANQSGTVTFTTLDSFLIIATQVALATVTSAMNAAFYMYYTVQTGQPVSVTPNGVKNARAVFSNENAYFTTDNGILKLERQDLPILKAGIPPGLDIEGKLGKTATLPIVAAGPILANTQVAYKVLFGRKDANMNLILGEPSAALPFRNTITDVGPGGLSYNAATNVLTITSIAHGLTSGDTVYLFNVVCTGGAVPDRTAMPITVTSVDVFTVDFDDIAQPDIATVTSLSYGVNKTAYLTFTIPSEITSTEYIYQIYRTTQSVDSNTLPEENYRLLQEANLTTADLANTFVTFIDEVDQILVQSGAQLYTNPSVEGPLQENSRPPRAKDAVLFKNYVIYANTLDYRAMVLALVAPSLITSGDYMTLGTQSYVFVGNANNEPVGNESTTSPATTAAYVEVTQVNHGFVVNDVIRVTATTVITGIAPGIYTISAVPSANTFRFGAGAAAGPGTVTYEGTVNASGRYFVKRYVAAPGTPGVTLSESIDYTARLLVKAINRNANSTVYAKYTSSPTSTPGQMYFEAKDLNAVTFSATVSTVTASQAFSPDLPTSGTTVSDVQDSNPNGLRIAKLLEPEATPKTNFIPVASKAAEILRIEPLRDSLIIIKADGVYRLNGDSLNNFSVTALDTTVICKATNSVVVLNNSVFALTNQGVVQITDSSVRISSREIEPLLTAVIGNQNLENLTGAVGYESERTYLLSTLKPNSSSTIPDVVYAYNYLTNAWTTDSGPYPIFSTGLVSSLDDKLLLVQADAKSIVNKERKEQTKVDFSEQETCLPILVSIISQASVTLGSQDVTVTTAFEHLFKVGQLLTISNTAATLNAAFAGGSLDLVGLRTITSVTTMTFTFTASSAATAGATGTLHYQTKISEADISGTTTNGSPVVTFTTAMPHQLLTGNAINVNSLSTVLATGFATSADLLGYRTVVVISPTVFTVLSVNASILGVTGTANISDRNQEKLQVTAITNTNYIIQKGDAIVTGNSLYTIINAYQYSSTAYILTLRFKYKQLSTDLAFINSAYKSSLRFAPLTFGNPSLLKSFGEFQGTFRNNASCSQMNVNFSTDGFVSSRGTDWDFAVGTGMIPFLFGGWGSLPWGNFPWGGGTSIQREFTTRPAVLLRIYTPMEASFGTYIQPILEHKVAGEPLELQSVAIYYESQSQRVGK